MGSLGGGKATAAVVQRPRLGFHARLGPQQGLGALACGLCPAPASCWMAAGAWAGVLRAGAREAARAKGPALVRLGATAPVSGRRADPASYRGDVVLDDRGWGAGGPWGTWGCRPSLQDPQGQASSGVTTPRGHKVACGRGSSAQVCLQPPDPTQPASRSWAPRATPGKRLMCTKLGGSFRAAEGPEEVHPQDAPSPVPSSPSPGQVCCGGAPRM